MSTPMDGDTTHVDPMDVVPMDITPTHVDSNGWRYDACRSKGYHSNACRLQWMAIRRMSIQWISLHRMLTPMDVDPMAAAAVYVPPKGKTPTGLLTFVDAESVLSKKPQNY